MATIIRFTLPMQFSNQLNGVINRVQLVNAVQSELNQGVKVKGTFTRSTTYKQVKDSNGKKRMVQIKKTKAGESLQCEDTIANRFESFCNAYLDLLQFTGKADVDLMTTDFADWLNKMKLETPEAKESEKTTWKALLEKQGIGE